MKLPTALLFGLIVLAGFFVALTPKVQAAEGDTLLFDNFNDGDFNGWTIESGQWWINNGNLVGAKSGKAFGGKINTGSSKWDNYRLELDVNGFQGIDQGVGIRYTQDGYYEINLRYGTGMYDTPQIKLWKKSATSSVMLTDTHSFSLVNQKWYHLKIEVLNENIKIWIDNALVFDFTDTGTNIKKGTVALSYWTGDISVAYMRFDNVKITALAPPPPRLPVIFIPGIGGSEMKATQDIYWSKDDGHGGTYSHAYGANEKIWVNQDKAVELGDDDYFDVLKLKADGVTAEADLSLTGNLTAFGYAEIDSFFTGIGYEKGKNFFVFPYDWRKDVRSAKDSLDALIESAKTTSGQPKVNLVVHSMGGLIARYYISDAGKATKVNKLIELGVPHLGAVDSLKAIVYGKPLGRQILGDFYLGVPSSEVKDILQNLPSGFQILPSKSFFNFYNNSNDFPYPFRDDRDIDNNNITGSLNFNQTKNLLSNLSYNMTVFNLAEQFHDNLDPIFNQTNGTQIHEIVGTSQPTLGQIRETWWITWPVNLFNKTDEIFINGDGTVPLYSASLKNDSTDISGAFKIYYVEQKHGDLVSGSGTAMQTVRKILEDDNVLPVEVKDKKIYLEGEQVSLDDGELDLYDGQNRHCGLNSNGEMEENIPEVTCTTSGNTRHAFIKKKAGKVKVKATRKTPTTSSKTTNIKKRTYKQDKISKTAIYKNINIPQAGKIEFDLDPAVNTSPTLTLYSDSSNSNNTTIINPSSEVSGSSATDQTPPTTSTQVSGTQNSGGAYTGTVTVTLTATDTGSGILNTQYTLDNGQTVQTYTNPFIISAPGTTTIQVSSTDNTGNEEIPQTITVQIAAPPTPTPTPTPSSSTASSTNSTTSEVGSDSSEVNVTTTTASSVIARNTANTPGVGPDSPGVDSGILGLNFENSSHISDQINVTGLLNQQNLIRNKNPAKEILGGLLIVSGGIVAVASFGLALTFLKPIPK